LLHVLLLLLLLLLKLPLLLLLLLLLPATRCGWRGPIRDSPWALIWVGYIRS
jgi:hypothetical protein